MALRTYTAPHRKVSGSSELRESMNFGFIWRKPDATEANSPSVARLPLFRTSLYGSCCVLYEILGSLSSSENDTFRWGAVYCE